MRRLTWLFVLGLLLVPTLGAMAQADLEQDSEYLDTVLPSWTTGMPWIPVETRFSELDEINIALIKDGNNWWGEQTELLDGYEDVVYDVINSSDVETTDFSDYVAVIVDGNQNSTFYTNLNASIDVLGDYVEDGGWLEYHGGTNAHNPLWELWDGTSHIYQNSAGTNYIQVDDHPVFEDEDDPQGNNCNHGYLVDYPDDATVLLSVNTDGTLPTMIEYEHGLGNVVVTTLTLAHMWNNDLGGAYVLPNLHEYVIWHPTFGTLEGNVTDSSDDPIEDAEITVYAQEDTSLVAQTYTDENGDYIISETLYEMDYIVTAFAPGYTMATEDSVGIVSEDTTVVDFSLDDNDDTVSITGTVGSADTPDSLVEGITVSIPVLDVSDVTDADGEFDLGTHPTGYYTIVVSGDPAGSEGFHDKTIAGVAIDEDAMPLDLYVYEILEPTAFSLSSGSEQLTLSWGPPDNHPEEEEMMLVEQEIDNLRASIDDIQRRNIPEEVAKLPLVEQRLHMLTNIHADMVRAEENDQELDELIDFLGYRVKIIYPNGMEDVLDNVIGGESHTIQGLINGTLYSCAVAADYGYGDDYLVWTDTLSARPLPVASTYIVSETNYDWIEINPDEDGDGSVAIQAGDDSNSGEVSFDPLSFPFFGEEYDSFGACTNGWFSFTNFTSGTITLTFPSTWEPNAVVSPLNGDYHAGVAGDGMGIWYLVDEDNDQVIIQFKLRPYSGNTQYRFSYQAILDCETGAITMQYEEADDWPYYIRGGIGIENEDGTTAYTHPYQNVEDEYAIVFQPPDWTWAGINGVVSDSITDDPVVGAEIVATDADGETWYAETDDNGWYTVLVDSSAGPWDLEYSADGYSTVSVEGVEIDEGFDTTVDVALLPAGTISGTILDYSDEDPVIGATITVESAGGDVWTTTSDDTGYYEFVREFDLDDTYEVIVTAEGYAEDSAADETFAEGVYFLTLDFDLVPMGSIEGTITDVDENIVANAMVTLTDENGDEYNASSNDEGWYEFVRILDRDLSYDMEVIANQYEPNTDHTDLTFGEDEYTITQDVEMDWVSAETPPVLGNVGRYNDNGIDVSVYPPGFVGNEILLQYDNGTPGNATYLNTNSEDWNWATVFSFEGDGTVLQGDIRLTSENEQWQPAPWPDGVHDPIVAMCWANGDDDLPGELLFTSDEITTSEEEPWAIFEPGVTVSEQFWIGFYVPPTDNTSEALCGDGTLDHGQSYLYYTTTGWATGVNYSTIGDPMMRATVLAIGGGGMLSMETPDVEAQEFVPTSKETTPNNAAIHGSYDIHNFREGPNPLRPGVYARAGLFGNNELDEFDGFIFYTSTDGETFEQYNDDPVTEDEIPYFLEYGSEWESDVDGENGEHIYYYVTAMNTVGGDEIESDPTDETEEWFWMPPSAPDNVTVIDIDMFALTGTITWSEPTTNEDGSELVDLDGYYLYRDEELIATLDSGVTSYDEQVEMAGYYSYQIEAFDEVPNNSATAHAMVDGSQYIQIGSAPYWTSFEPDADIEQDIPFESGDVWQLGEPTAGPGEAHDGDEALATYLDGNYNNNDDATVASIHAWHPTEGAVLVKYWHWTNYEGYWDGYQMMYSTDGDTWTIADPIGGYNYASISGLDGQRGFSTNTNGWVQVTYDLTDQVAQADSFWVAFRHGTDGSVNSYYGVAIDELEMWGVEGMARASLYGYVMDTEDQPMEGVRVYVEQYPTYEAFTDQSGYYFIFNTMAEETLSVATEYPCYWPSRMPELYMEDRDTMEVNFTNEVGRAMSYPDGEPSTTALEIFVNLNDNVGDSMGTAEFDLTSEGSGNLAWNAYVWVIQNMAQIAGQADGESPGEGKDISAGPQTQNNGRMMRKVSSGDFDPTLSFQKQVQPGPVQPTGELDELFDQLMTFDAQTLSGNPGIVGAVTLDDGIYVSAVYLPQGDVGDNFLYQFDHMGNPQAARTYPQEVIGSNGMGPIDLAYHPTEDKIYAGNNDGDIYKFNPDLTDVEWVANIGIWPMAIAVDYEDEYLYALSGVDNFVLYDLVNGGQTGLMIDPAVGGVLGLAFNPVDTDGYKLWALATNEDGEGGILHRFSTADFTWDVNFHELYSPDFGAAGGMEITRGYHSARYDITTVLQGQSDFVDIWEGNVAPLDWLYLEPGEGEILPSENTTVTVNVDVRAGKVDTLGYEVGDEVAAEIVLGGPYWCNPPVVDLVIVFIDQDDNVEETDGLPTKYALHQNYPNPFNPTTSIKFDLVEAQNVKLSIYNVMGQEVAQLVNQRMEAGYHAVSFDARALASGVYFYRIEAGDTFMDLKRMVLVK